MIIPLGIMFFCILFNYTILRDINDVLMMTAKGSSAKIVPFLKTWVNLPMTIGFLLLYTKLSNVLSKEALFYTMIFPFVAFFGAFAFLLYPLRDVIHPTVLADRLLAALDPSFLGAVAILRIGSFCLFYVMAELWGSVVISVLFWGFVNQDKSKFIDTGYRNIENRHKPLVMKELKKLQSNEHGLPWQKGEYSPLNTLLVDSSPCKVICNPVRMFVSTNAM